MKVRRIGAHLGKLQFEYGVIAIGFVVKSMQLSLAVQDLIFQVLLLFFPLYTEQRESSVRWVTIDMPARITELFAILSLWSRRSLGLSGWIRVEG